MKPLHTTLNPFSDLPSTRHLSLFSDGQKQQEISKIALTIIKEMRAIVDQKTSFFPCCAVDLSSWDKEDVAKELIPELNHLKELLSEVGDADEIAVIQKAFKNYIKESDSFFEHHKRTPTERAFPSTTCSNRSKLILLQNQCETQFVLYRNLLTSDPDLKKSRFKEWHVVLNRTLTQFNDSNAFNTSLISFWQAHGPLFTMNQLMHLPQEHSFQYAATLAAIKKKFPNAPVHIENRLSCHARQYFEILIDATSSIEEKIKTVVSLCAVIGIPPLEPVAHLIVFEKTPLSPLTFLEIDEITLSSALATFGPLDLMGYQNIHCYIQKVIEIGGIQSNGLQSIRINGLREQTIALIVDIDQITTNPLKILYEVELCLKTSRIFPRIYLLKLNKIAESEQNPDVCKKNFTISLLTALFHANLQNIGPSRNFLNAIIEPTIFPSTPFTFSLNPNDRNQLKIISNFSAFGMFLAACHNERIKIIDFFDSYFWNLLCIKGVEKFLDGVLLFRESSDISWNLEQRISIENQFIYAWLRINKYSLNIMSLFHKDTAATLSQGRKNDLINQITAMFEMWSPLDLSDIERETPSSLLDVSSEEDIETARQYLLCIAKNDGRFIASAIIAKAAHNFLGDDGWLNFQESMKP